MTRNAWFALFLFRLTACGGLPEVNAPTVEEMDQPFTSDVATLLNFEFDGELLTSSVGNLKSQVRAQLLYTVGHFNGRPGGVARLDKLVTTRMTSTWQSSGLYKVKYHAKLPVAWGAKTNLPTTSRLTLPRRVDAAGQTAFTARYGATCNEGGGYEVGVANFWYHYRPFAAGCSLAEGDVMSTNATVTLSTENATTKYPEYHKVWDDDALNVVAVFGKYENGGTTSSDAGVAAYNDFLRTLRTEFPAARFSVPTGALPGSGDLGASYPDITMKASRTGGGTITITMLLVDEVSTAPASFDKRYSELTPGADLIIYSGHAGLGANVASLSRKGKFFPGKYQIIFINGCDTFAYVDNTLATVRAVLNPDDPTGTKYMDVLTNAMPAYFSSMPRAALSLIRALVDHTRPTSYANIVKNVDSAQIVVVTGEEDNVFTPYYDPGPQWNGINVSGATGYKQTFQYSTEQLPAGRYVFTMTPDPSAPGGDADLRVRAGTVPSTANLDYKCKSYIYNSNERCVVTLTAPSQVFFNVTGDGQTTLARYSVNGWQE